MYTSNKIEHKKLQAVPLFLLLDGKCHEHQTACDVWGMPLDHRDHTYQLA